MKKVINRYAFMPAAALLLSAVFIALSLMFAYSGGLAEVEVKSPDVIELYKVDMSYAELNRRYVAGEGLTIDESFNKRLVMYSDLATIAAMSGVRDLLMLDERIVIEIDDAVMRGKLLDKPYLMSVPDWIHDDFLGPLGIPYKKESLVEGRLPKDGASEIALSYTQLLAFCGLDDSQAENPLGMTVTLEGVDYTVVGVTAFDVGFVSYEEGDKNGFFLYSTENMDEYVRDVVSLKTERDYVGPLRAGELFVLCEEGKEASVLDALIGAYPAENYLSHHFSEVFVREYNKALHRNAFVGGLIPAAMLGVVCAMLAAYWVYKSRKKCDAPHREYLRVLGAMLIAALMIAVAVVLFTSENPAVCLPVLLALFAVIAAFTFAGQLLVAEKRGEQ